MSLLRQALKSRLGTSSRSPSASSSDSPPPPPKKSYARSIRSVASVKTFAASLASFYTFSPGSSGGPRQAKRRRAPRSELGRPAFTSREPVLGLVDGVEMCGEGGRVSGVTCVRTLEEGGRARVSLLVNHFAENGERGVVFYGGTEVTGEVRLVVSKPEPIESIEVWIALKTSCTFAEGEPNAMDMRATLWSRDSSGVVQPGTYAFPFAFDPFPSSVVVKQEEKKSVTGRPLARVPLPPSYNVRAPHWMGRIEYEMGLVVKRKGLKHNDYIEIPLTYMPRQRLKPLPPPAPFPLIPTRDDWPFERENIGNWSLTPFGGRGRWCGEKKIELEGLLGIPYPTVAHAGSKICMTLLLWGTHSEALAALSATHSVHLRLVRAHVMGLDALTPSSRAHTNRVVFESERWNGAVWADGEREVDVESDKSEGDSGVEIDGVVDETGSGSASASGGKRKGKGKKAVEISMDEEEDDDDEAFPGAVDAGNIVKLHGSVCVPPVEECVPSFRYKNMAVEYLLQVVITHKDYNHISPTGPGIVGEVPVWIVTGPSVDSLGPASSPSSNGRQQRRFVGRSIVLLPRDAKRMTPSRGSLVSSAESQSER
ncbi:hypothetical protein BDV93DRAFT_610871 [Ceratobasidium sp. AG-I]|nr:hypothetical protein BDV93DRAFT_610871 [Ceratobasidium sp. AG-I]